MDQTMEIIKGLIADEQERGSLKGLDDLRERRAKRQEIEDQLRKLEGELRDARWRIQGLPALPSGEQIRWGQAVLALGSALRILELDTTGLSKDDDLIRCTILKGDGSELFDSLIQPTGPIYPDISRITGIRNEQLENAPPIAQVWKALSACLRGGYVISYGLDFDLGKLDEAAKRYGLEPIPIIGECLMQQAMRYFGTSAYPKLAALCERLGDSLPAYPHQTALDRARGQLRLLNAMANGLTGPVAFSELDGYIAEDDEKEKLDTPSL